MASLTSTINLVDRMSPVLLGITSAVDNVVSAMDRANRSMDNTFDPNLVYQARTALGEANARVREMEDGLRKSAEQQSKLNHNIKDGQSEMDKLANGAIGMASVYATMQGVQKIAGLSDEYTQTQARLNMIVNSEQELAQVQDQIFASAQRSRASYGNTADVVAKLALRAGDVWDSNQQTILFAENLNKMFTIAGASQEEMNSASLQLTQALGSGVLRGEELNAVFESAPNVIQAIADYMGQPIGKIRELAKDGQITSQIVKDALLSSTDEINQQFENMPMTWSQVWTQISNEVLYASQPILEVINTMANNWSILEPAVIGVATAVGLYVAALGLAKGAQLAHAAATAISTAFNGTWTASTFAQSVAQGQLNAALLACPITWIVLAVIAFIAIIYAAVAAINKWQGTTISATGVIAGAFMAVLAFVGNLFIGAYNLVAGIFVEGYNLVASFANFIGNIFNDPIAAILHLFGDMFDFIAGIVQSAAGLIDTVFGSNLSESVAGVRTDFSNLIDDIVGDKYVTYFEKQNQEDYKMDRFKYSHAYNVGYDWGVGIEDNVKGMFGSRAQEDNSLDNLKKLAGVDNINDKLNSIDKNTKKTAKSVSLSATDIRYMLDIASRRSIDRYTTSEIKVDVVNHNVVNKDLDIDGVANTMSKKILKEINEQWSSSVG